MRKILYVKKDPELNDTEIHFALGAISEFLDSPGRKFRNEDGDSALDKTEVFKKRWLWGKDKILTIYVGATREGFQAIIDQEDKVPREHNNEIDQK